MTYFCKLILIVSMISTVRRREGISAGRGTEGTYELNTEATITGNGNTFLTSHSDDATTIIFQDAHDV